MPRLYLMQTDSCWWPMSVWLFFPQLLSFPMANCPRYEQLMKQTENSEIYQKKNEEYKVSVNLSSHCLLKTILAKTGRMVNRRGEDRRGPKPESRESSQYHESSTSEVWNKGEVCKTIWICTGSDPENEGIK